MCNVRAHIVIVKVTQSNLHSGGRERRKREGRSGRSPVRLVAKQHNNKYGVRYLDSSTSW